MLRRRGPEGVVREMEASRRLAMLGMWKKGGEGRAWVAMVVGVQIYDAGGIVVVLGRSLLVYLNAWMC